MSKLTGPTANQCKSILRSVEKIFSTEKFTHLNNTAYKFITLRMGFIAHYNQHGFIAHYEEQGIEQFAYCLIHGELNIPNYNETHAHRILNFGHLDDQYPREDCIRIGETMKAIIKMAEEKLEETKSEKPN